MDPLSEEPRAGRTLQIVAFVASAAVAAATLRFAWHRPLVAAAILGGMVAMVGFRWYGRVRARRLLRSGDVQSVLERWSPSLARIPHSGTMAPLMTATAFAAYGWVDQARAAIGRRHRGAAWDAALEHRLFLDALLLTFEGDRDGSLEQAGRLERLPPPPAGEAIRDRVVTLRSAVAALARAFAHQSRAGDADLLERASESSPLVFWAMRYGGAVVAIDHGDTKRALRLVERAPAWPEESTFRAFHDEILLQSAAGSGATARRATEPEAPSARGSHAAAEGSTPPPANAP